MGSEGSGGTAPLLALDGCECSASHAGCFIPREEVCDTQKEVYAPEVVGEDCKREESIASARY